MAKSAHKRPENDLAGKKDDSSFIAVDQKSFDPSIASLFATSVRIHTRGNFRKARPRHSMTDILRSSVQSSVRPSRDTMTFLIQLQLKSPVMTRV